MWPGLLKSILDSDIHIVLDSVKSSKNDRYNRNLIAGSLEKRWLTVPFVDFSRDKLIRDLTIDNSQKSVDNLENIFCSRYKDAPYLAEAIKLVKCINPLGSNYLSDAYLTFLNELNDLGVSLPKIIKSQHLLENVNIANFKSPIDLINYLLQSVESSTYLAAHNVQSYSNKADYSVSNVYYQNFNPMCYEQYKASRENSEFIPYLSILDYIASVGLNDLYSYLDRCNEWS